MTSATAPADIMIPEPSVRVQDDHEAYADAIDPMLEVLSIIVPSFRAMTELVGFRVDNTRDDELGMSYAQTRLHVRHIHAMPNAYGNGSKLILDLFATLTTNYSTSHLDPACELVARLKMGERDTGKVVVLTDWFYGADDDPGSILVQPAINQDAEGLIGSTIEQVRQLAYEQLVDKLFGLPGGTGQPTVDQRGHGQWGDH